MQEESDDSTDASAEGEGEGEAGDADADENENDENEGEDRDEPTDADEDKPQPTLPGGRYMADLTSMSFSPIGGVGATKDHRVKLGFTLTGDEQGVPLHEVFEGDVKASDVFRLNYRDFMLGEAVDLRDKRTGREMLRDTFGTPVKATDGKLKLDATGQPVKLGGFMNWNFSIDPKKIKFSGRCMLEITRAPSKVTERGTIPEKNYIQAIYAIPSPEDDADFASSFAVSEKQANKLRASAEAAAATGAQATSIKDALAKKSGPARLTIKKK